LTSGRITHPHYHTVFLNGSEESLVPQKKLRIFFDNRYVIAMPAGKQVVEQRGGSCRAERGNDDK